MRPKNRTIVRGSISSAVVIGVLCSAGIFGIPAIAQDGAASDFPSWDEVQRTKDDAAAKSAQIGEISGLLSSLEADSAQLGDAAVEAGAHYATIAQQLETVNAQVSVLAAQAQRAAEQADEHKKVAVAVAVQSYKSGGTNFGVLTTVADLESATSLNGVDLMQKVGERAVAQQNMATESLAAASQMQKTREAAQAVQKDLAQEASTARDDAVSAQQTMNQKLAAQQTHSDTLVAQLAFLNERTVSAEREYREAQQAQANYEQVQAAKQQAEEAAQLANAKQQQILAQQPASRPVAEPQSKPVPVPAPEPAPAPKPVPVPNPAPSVPPAPEPIAPKPPVDNGGSGPLDPGIPGGAVNDPAGAKAYAAASLASFGWGQEQFSCLDRLWERESNWRTNATNPSSGAYGIAQALPASKYGLVASDWLTNYRTQITWGLDYMAGRYGSPCGAWQHSETVGWY